MLKRNIRSNYEKKLKVSKIQTVLLSKKIKFLGRALVLFFPLLF